MRQKELSEGITVTDKYGVPLGTSSKAGWTAVSQTAVSRAVSAFPVMFVPGLIMSRLERTSWLRSNPRLGVPMNLLTVSACLMSALPPSIALFPQMATMDVMDLEDKFKNMKDSKGDALERVQFNRGL
jgi:sideroflexin-5